VDTALGLIWHDIAPALRPDLAVAVIHRPVADVADSLDRIGARVPLATLHKLADRLALVRGSHFTYSQIGTYDGCARLAWHCSGEALDPERWEEADDTPIECDFAAYQRDVAANAEGVRAIYGEELRA
jgi:hypothetical protein